MAPPLSMPTATPRPPHEHMLDRLMQASTATSIRPTPARLAGGLPIALSCLALLCNFTPGIRRATPPHLPTTPYPHTHPSASNYLVSFGDNYCIGALTQGVFFPTETPYTIWPPVPGQPRIGWPGYQGTYADINANLPPATGATPGTLRGMFDCTTNQSVRIASITDGTSNTIAAGESLPAQRGDNNVWQFNANADGTTVPINYPTPQTCDPLSTNGFGTPNWASRCSYANTGFKSHHPGGGNFLFADGSVHFLKQSIAMTTYCALGSRNGGEVISADAY